MIAATVGLATAWAQPSPAADSTRADIDSATARSPRWALVLSGGIARGFAHAGIIQALEEEGIRPDLVVGSSMGGLVGAMYAAGYPPDSMRAVLRKVPWDLIFSGGPSFSQWRSLWPPPWVQLVNGSGGALQIPAALVDNTVINHVLIQLFLNADADCQGDFDRLSVPFRTIGTDVRTGRWVMLDHGSLARACRITAGLPLMFAPVTEGNALLVDGGMSSNLPITPARAAGAERVLAVDVALPYPELDESSSGLVVFMQLWDLLNKRGQSDTVSVAAGDTLVWLKIPDADAADFAGGADIMDQGYAEAGAAVRSWARRSGLPPARAPLTRPPPVMPPLAGAVEWGGPRPVRRAEVARAVLGRLPSGEFQPMELLPAIRRLALSGLFESAWPTLVNRGDSTVLSFEVRERPELSLAPALTLGNDEGARFHLGLTLRPTQGPLPALARIGGAIRSLGPSVHFSLEPYALDYGTTGWFLRGRWHDLRTRVFRGGEEQDRLETERFEAFVGGQVGITMQQTFQAGMGWAHLRGSGPDWDGLLFAFRTQGAGRGERNLDAEWAVGDDGYSRISASLTHPLRWRVFVMTPGVRAGGVEGEAPADALVGLGGPGSLSGLHYDEWLGRRMLAGSLELAVEATRQARAYLAGQMGRVEEAVSGDDIGPGAVAGFGIGAEVGLPIGPLRIEWGIAGSGRERFDILLGMRF
jgi:predicted acylesterase/phospholipase RssA